jgi:hypothetical protein
LLAFVHFYFVNFSTLTQPLEQEQEHVWTLVPLRQQGEVYHRYCTCDRPCFQAARARAVLLEGVLRQQKAGARRPLGVFAVRVVVLLRVSAFLLAHFTRAVCLPFSGAASVTHACNRCACHILLVKVNCASVLSIYYNFIFFLNFPAWPR